MLYLLPHYKSLSPPVLSFSLPPCVCSGGICLCARVCICVCCLPSVGAQRPEIDMECPPLQLCTSLFGGQGLSLTLGFTLFIQTGRHKPPNQVFTQVLGSELGSSCLCSGPISHPRKPLSPMADPAFSQFDGHMPPRGFAKTSVPWVLGAAGKSAFLSLWRCCIGLLTEYTLKARR